jgi:arylsulfatase A-like enzyme
MWLKGWIPYEECCHVPLIIRWPQAVAPHSKTSHLVQTHDLAHTYVQVAAAKPMVYADGRSLVPLFENPQRTDWREEILGVFYGGEFLYTQRLLVTQRFKYVFNGFDIDELYDLERDPQEMRNVAYSSDYHPYADDMRARLYELMAQFEDPYGDRPLADQGFRYDRYGAARYLPRGRRL